MNSRGDGSQQGSDRGGDPKEFHKMSDEEFFETIRSRTADELGVSKDEMDQMEISEIEQRLGIKTGEPRGHNDHRGGYFVKTKRFNVLSNEEIKQRENKVERFLNKF